MDESRPRHQTRRLPLIIERADLTHPLRRVLAVLLTVLAWLVWLAMWIPLLATLGRHYGHDLPEIVFPSPISLHSFLTLMQIAPYVLGIAIGVVLLSYLWEKTGARKVEKRWRPVGMERLATGAALDPQQLAEWQSAQILYVEHGPRGRVTNAGTSPPEPEAAAAKNDRQQAPGFPHSHNPAHRH